MHRTDVDGVPVLWEQGPAPMRATLSFGVGVRDETFRTLGVTHLVEHLAMGALPRVHYDRNASVDLVTTDFTVCGRPEQAAEFLAGICRSLTELPVDRIVKEAGVLAAEGGHHAHPTIEGLLHERFGARGPGLAVYTGPGYDRLTAEHVRQHAARFFVDSNAVLHLTGPPPDGLRLPLAAGPRPGRERIVPRAQPGPTWAEAPVPSVGVSLLGRRDAAWSLAMGVLAERLEQRARHEHGLSYQVDGDAVSLGGDEMLMALAVDARRGQEAAVADLLWQELQRLADEGPSDDDLAHEVAGIREMHDDPRYIEVDLARAAEALLFDLPYRSRDERLAALVDVTPELVRACFAAAVPTVQIVVPADVVPALPGLGVGGCARTRTEPPGRAFKPPLLAKLMTREARGRRLILTADGVAQRDPDGDVHVVRWADVIGVAESGPERLVFGANGCQIIVDPELFMGAEVAVAAVDANVPAALRYERSELIADD